MLADTCLEMSCLRLIQGRVLRRDLETMSVARDDCMDPMLGYMDPSEGVQSHGVVRRQEAVVPGYVTTDDWGTDGTSGGDSSDCRCSSKALSLVHLGHDPTPCLTKFVLSHRRRHGAFDNSQLRDSPLLGGTSEIP